MPISLNTILLKEIITIGFDSDYNAPKIEIREGETKISIILTRENAALFLAIANSKFKITDEEIDAAKKRLGL